MSLDKKIKTLRLEYHMTQEDLARRLNVSRSTVAGYETKNRQPSHEKLAALAGLFHVSVDYLIDDSSPSIPLREITFPEVEQRLLAQYAQSFSPDPGRISSLIFILLELRDQAEPEN